MGGGGLEIGCNSSISMKTAIYSASHKSWSETFESYTRRTVIGDGVWVCINAVVLVGTEVADKVIVSANSVIKGKTEIGGIYMGIPAKLVRMRELNRNVKMRNTNFFL